MAGEIADLFHTAVHAIDERIYTAKQKEAWAPTPTDMIKWQTRLNQKRPHVALVGPMIAGFIELEADGHIDCAYVRPDFQSKGVGTALYQEVKRQAIEMRLKRLYVEASLVARKFFAKQGFREICENHIERNGQILVNYSMELML